MNEVSKIESLITPAIERAGALVEEVKLATSGKFRNLTILVDHENRHLTLDEVTAISKEISTLLDQHSPLGEMPFNLEVSSPGIDRPLTKPRHFRKNLGRLVKVVRVDGEQVAGRIESVDSVLKVDGKEIAWDEIKRAVIEVEFRRKEGK